MRFSYVHDIHYVVVFVYVAYICLVCFEVLEHVMMELSGEKLCD